jgi:branched-chain amino acid transport system ATP-binding protein
MNATETEACVLIEGIRRDGMTVLLIEHDVKLVMGLCDRVAVLDYGRRWSSRTCRRSCRRINVSSRLT